jgi:hypothetical protein
MARALALLLLLGCASADPLGPPDFGEPVGPLMAKLEAETTTFEMGSTLKFKITLKNNGSTRDTIQLPDMNEPVAWKVTLMEVGERDKRHTGLGYGNPASVGAPRNEKPVRIAIEPFDEKSFEIFLRGRRDGWSYFGTDRVTKRAWASPASFPGPGRYRVRAAYTPFHAEHPNLQELPGWGVKTNEVEIEIVSKP